MTKSTHVKYFMHVTKNDHNIDRTKQFMINTNCKHNLFKQ